MGRMKERAKLRVNENLYKVTQWEGSGWLVSSEHPVPARLHKFNGEDWNQLDEWSGTNQGSGRRKSEQQVINEGINRLSVYEQSPVAKEDVEIIRQ